MAFPQACFWEQTSFPSPACFLEKKFRHLREDLARLLQSTVQDYSDNIKEAASRSPSPKAVGKVFDVVNLLSGGHLIRSNGYRVDVNADTFKGRHVMVCCFYVPVIPWKTDVCFQSLVNLCNELYSTRRDEFEMVVVARMNALANDGRVFNHFFSGFPSSCLAVPFDDHHRRDHICKVLGLGLDHCLFESLFLNPEGVVLPPLGNKMFMYYGAEAFPFSEDDLRKRDSVCRDIVYRKARLDRVLKCNDDSPGFVYKFNGGGPREMVSISQLRKKNVGVYLCSRGDLIPKLLKVYEQCKERQLEIEIVVVYLPFATVTDPKIFQREIDSLLKKHNVHGWYCLPFNNSVSKRFWQLVYDHYDVELEDMLGLDIYYDKLFMVGPCVKKKLDIYGGDLIFKYGVDAYPFTAEAASQMPNQGLFFEFRD